jgi:tetratricopeptide (TPR) repeat protein
VASTEELLALASSSCDKGDFHEAEQLYRQALEQDPRHAEGHHGLGAALRGQGRLAEAVASFQQAVQLRPDFVEAYNALGSVFAHSVLADRAPSGPSSAQPSTAAQADPARAAAARAFERGMMLQQISRIEEALACFEDAVHADPDHADAWNCLAACQHAQMRYTDAIASYQRAIACKPDFAIVYNNLAQAYLAVNRPEDVAACCRDAIRLKPDFAEAYKHLAVALKLLGRPEEAEVQFEEARRLRPACMEPTFDLAETLLRLGEYELGWREYEGRWRVPAFAAMRPEECAQPAWDGSPLEGRTILLRAEQGLGDTLQFIRFAPLVHDRGGRVIVEAPPVLAGVLRSCRGVEQVSGGTPHIPATDVYAFMLSLPGLLGITLANLPAQVPYLFADPTLLAKWREELIDFAGFKVGIIWQGRQDNPQDQKRSVSLAQFAALADIPGVHLLSLQVGLGTAQLSGLAGGLQVTDLGSRFNPTSFDDAAAVIENLDLLISVDTSLAHLAGALGKPVWVALASRSDWRWLLDREDSPWYPTMRLFRQKQPGQWREVFDRIHDALRARLSDPPSGLGRS